MIFEIASEIANPYSLIAFAVAAVLYAVLKYRNKVPDSAFNNALVAIVLMIVLPLVVGKVAPLLLKGDVYHARVTVVGPTGTPVENAKVWSSIGGEPKKVSGGWQFDIPEANVPADRTVTFYASRKSEFLNGKQEVRIQDLNAAITVELKPDKSATVRGVVVDVNDDAVSGARVSVTGHGKDAVVTDSSGSFSLPAHAANGQEVLLRAQKEGYETATQWHPAGDSPGRLLLRHKND